MNLEISPAVTRKLAEKHDVRESEIIECFSDRGKVFLKDKREDHKTDPPTLWFIGETDRGKRLKVVFIYKNGQVIIKTAYPPNGEEERIYTKFARKGK